MVCGGSVGEKFFILANIKENNCSWIVKKRYMGVWGSSDSNERATGLCSTTLTLRTFSLEIYMEQSNLYK